MPFCKLFYHFVWSTKYRKLTITDLLKPHLYASIVAKAADLHAIIHAVNGMEEHVHLVAELPPTLAPATFIGKVKGYSSHSANLLKHVPLRERFRWQTEYSVHTVSERALPIVIRYVQNQQLHHRKKTTNTNLEDW